MAKIGIIGGSGLNDIEGLQKTDDLIFLDTPFGRPSDRFIVGLLEGVEVIFLARHGKGHHIAPSQVNYRANIFEMKRLGVDAIISISAVGSLQEQYKPLDFILPDQFVDRTNYARESSFFTEQVVAHVSMAEPISPEIRDVLLGCCNDEGVTIHKKGTYINMEGPQFSTRAESHLYRQWGMDVIGMTNMVEAKLAREAEISYASLCSVTDYDCWHPGHDSVTVDMIMENLQNNAAKAKEIIKKAIPKVGALTNFSAKDALKEAIVTDPGVVPEQVKKQWQILIGKYISV
ncbi:MAG: S-methyl-5'-thioadenosine phosphorylase [Candidatus Omnitrophica bacterium]|nr:S-methyl-5'-thioadenosine phosphorylase [Candidatus Omnitrophota bacterium]